MGFSWFGGNELEIENPNNYDDLYRLGDFANLYFGGLPKTAFNSADSIERERLKQKTPMISSAMEQLKSNIGSGKTTDPSMLENMLPKIADPRVNAASNNSLISMLQQLSQQMINKGVANPQYNTKVKEEGGPNAAIDALAGVASGLGGFVSVGGMGSVLALMKEKFSKTQIEPRKFVPMQDRPKEEKPVVPIGPPEPNKKPLPVAPAWTPPPKNKQ